MLQKKTMLKLSWINLETVGEGRDEKWFRNAFEVRKKCDGIKIEKNFKLKDSKSL